MQNINKGRQLQRLHHLQQKGSHQNVGSFRQKLSINQPSSSRMAETLTNSPPAPQQQNPEPDPPPDPTPPLSPAPLLPYRTPVSAGSGSPAKAASLDSSDAPPLQESSPVGSSSVLAAGSDSGQEPKRQTFSQLLAGAMASGSSPKVAGLPSVTVPCFVTSQGFLESPRFMGQFRMSHQAALASVTAQAQMQLLTGNLSPSPSPTFQSISSPSTVSLWAKPIGFEEKVIAPEEESLNVSEQKSQSNRSFVKTTLGDGYNWRKYGQKQVKASENSRSYYRCTHLNCTAKKKVEHSQDGHVHVQTYQGEHSHEPPQKVKFPKERGSCGQTSGPLKDDHNLDLSSGERHNCPPKNDQDSKTEKSEQLHCSSACEVDPNTNAEEDVGEGPDHKRRLREVPVAYIPSLFKTAGHAKITVHSSCIEGPGGDGYRWRKYGQKNVKGSSSPRSYYKCTHTGCPVRKHVEKAEDAKTIITTYEGQHNHDIPPTKSSHDVPASVASDEQMQASNLVEKIPSECKTTNNEEATVYCATDSQVNQPDPARSPSDIGLDSNPNDKNGGNGSDIVQPPLYDESPAVVPVKNF